MHDISSAERDRERDDDAALPMEGRTLKRIGIVAAIVLVVLAAWGILSRRHADHQLSQWTQTQAVPTVAVFHPQPAEGTGALVLPGDVQAYNSAAVNARTSGYVRRWYVDIGSAVHAGQLMAVIDAPEVEQQLAQARADLQSARANQNLAQVTATRWLTLLKQDAVSQQETDERVGDLAARKAATNAALANVRRLEALIGFTRITAPFDGIVTSRATQIGQLVTAGNATAQPLFTVSQIREMRVYVRVPQLYSAQVRPGMAAQITLPEFPGTMFAATLSRAAQAVDQASGTELVELEAPNPRGALKPGAYAQVHFATAGPGHGVTIPASALLFRGDGTSVAVVDGSGKVTLKPVKIGVDHGATLDITSGLQTGDLAIDSPPDAIANGDKVHMHYKQPNDSQAGGGKGGSAQGGSAQGGSAKSGGSSGGDKTGDTGNSNGGSQGNAKS
jgi:RND family efflux transporter MFP subunit